MKLVLRILVFVAAICTACALCNTCSAVTGVACVANNQFQICVNGLPTSPTSQCPSGTICSAGPEICSATGSVQPPCARCLTCNGTKAFACTGYRTFALCHGTSTPDTVNYACTGSLVCNIDSEQICVDPAVTGLGGTCPLSTLTTTTTTTTTASPIIPNPATNPQGYCSSVAVPGRYDITTDTTCKQYVLCSLVSGAWRGNLYECPGSTLFNANSGTCGTQTPTRCA